MRKGNAKKTIITSSIICCFVAICFIVTPYMDIADENATTIYGMGFFLIAVATIISLKTYLTEKLLELNSDDDKKN